MNPQNRYHPIRNLYIEEGPYKGGPIPRQGSSQQGTQKQEMPVKPGMIGSMHTGPMGGMAPGGGGGTPPPGEEALWVTRQMMSQTKKKMMKMIQMKKLYQ